MRLLRGLRLQTLANSIQSTDSGKSTFTVKGVRMGQCISNPGRRFRLWLKTTQAGLTELSISSPSPQLCILICPGSCSLQNGSAPTSGALLPGHVLHSGISASAGPQALASPLPWLQRLRRAGSGRHRPAGREQRQKRRLCAEPQPSERCPRTQTGKWQSPIWGSCLHKLQRPAREWGPRDKWWWCFANWKPAENALLPSARVSYVWALIVTRIKS